MSELLPFPKGEYETLIATAFLPYTYVAIFAVVKIDEEGGWESWFRVRSPRNKVKDDRDIWTQNFAVAWRRYSAIVKRDGK